MLPNGVAVSIEQSTSTPQAAGGVFTTVLIDAGSTPLRATIVRQRRSHPLLVTLDLNGTASGTAAFTSDVNFRLIVGANPINTTVVPAPTPSFLLVTTDSIDLVSTTAPKARFQAYFKVLVPPELLPGDGTLDFTAQFRFTATTVPGGNIIVDPRQNVLAVQEIGPGS